jgi:[ribosomal protein S5]-alanine N-acetyltransferase
MKIAIETERLLIRELLPTDDQGMLELDSDKHVHIYLGNNPIKSIEEARQSIERIRQQYIDYGIGRWAVIEKSSGNFMGWSGLKLIKETTNGYINVYEVGYRFIRKYWGKGYATESVKPILEYGFNSLKQDVLYAMAHVDNKASRNVLEKSGLKYVNEFMWNDIPKNWFMITKSEWAGKNL